MPDPKHTPTPWRVAPEMNDILGPPNKRNPDGMIAVVRYLGNSEEARGETRANAQIIVRAVNAHDALVAALETCQNRLRDIVETAAFVGASFREERRDIVQDAQEAQRIVADALKLAKGDA